MYVYLWKISKTTGPISKIKYKKPMYQCKTILSLIDIGYLFNLRGQAALGAKSQTSARNICLCNNLCGGRAPLLGFI